MRALCVIMVALLVVGCGKPSEEVGPGDAVSSAEGVAFAYRFNFRLPSGRIADAQEAHAQACERLTSARCRITGMTYRLDGSGQVAATLDLKLSAPIARAFGRRSVQDIEKAGGALTGAEITGEDATLAAASGASAMLDTNTDLAEIDRELARLDLTPEVRNDLTNRRAEVLRAQREAKAARSATQAGVSTTPISFSYAAGSGVGLSARLAQAAHDGYVSLTWTVATVLTAVAYLGPPGLLFLLLLFVWRRFGRHWWHRTFQPDPIE